ncbi:MAG: glutathione peroxidase [Rhodospirillaceae bacterium]|nr:glutathione peroxidase [Rhodospirillaceae bacterium]|tara:strand:- start:145 stop:708 length:564 start_codon:yes stop_codon:yes gene_type:complete
MFVFSRNGRAAALFIMLTGAFGMQPAISAPVTAHDFTFENIEGGPLSLADFAGQPILLVNTASLCGFTPQYEALQALWEQYRYRGLVVLGVPSRDFGNQEYDNAAKTKSFCEVNYGIDFPMTEAVTIRGDAAHPYYQWVTLQGSRKTPRWNFYKHLIDGEGNLVDWFASTTPPGSPKIIRAIEKLLR